MTEVEWLSCEDPVTMMDYVRDRLRAPGQIDVSDRKLCMFAVAVWTAGGRGTANANAMAAIEKAEGRPPALRPGVSFSPINLAEAWAEEGNPPDRVPQAAKAAILRDLIGNPFRPVVLPPGPPCGACGGTGRFVVGSGEDGEAMACHPCDGTGRQPSPWLTPDVRTLAQAAYEGRVRSCPCGGGRYAMPAKVDCPACNGSGRIDDGTLDPLRLAVLADALEEAGVPPCVPKDDETPQALLARLLDVRKTRALGGMCIHDAGGGGVMGNGRVSRLAKRLQRAHEEERGLAPEASGHSLILTHWHTGNGHLSTSFQIEDRSATISQPVAWQIHLKNDLAISIIHDVAGELVVADEPHPLLAALRGPGPHYRGFAPLDTILGKE